MPVLRKGSRQYKFSWASIPAASEEKQFSHPNGLQPYLQVNKELISIVFNRLLFANFAIMKSECLYKYLDINGALSMIQNNELQFTNPIYFNDPFDCHPGLFDFQVPDGYSRGWMPKSFIQEKAICDSTNERRRVWICSLSKRHDSMLMWSYYANHKGVCIGLNKDKHTEFLSNGSLGLSFIANQEVDYRNVLEKPNGVCGAPFMYQLCTKSSQWQHEQEIRHIILDPHPWIPCRMIRPTSKDELIPWTEVRFYPKLSAECFDSIYLGARISESDKLRVLKAAFVSLPGIKVFQMIPDHESLSFVEEPVDVEKYLAEHEESSWTEMKSKVKKCLPFKIKVSIEWYRPRTVSTDTDHHIRFEEGHKLRIFQWFGGDHL